VWPPRVSVAVAVLVAPPPDNVTGDPKALPSIANWTAPVRVPEPGAIALTVAVNVTGCPRTDGLAEEATVVAVLAWFTVWESGDALLSLPVKFVSPPYTAVMLCGLPVTDSDEVANVATPDALGAPVPKVVAPSLKITVPEGVPPPGATGLTAAVNVTDCPNSDGLMEELRVVVVAAWLTVCDSADEVLVTKFTSPL